jgi:hypothetical protein
VEIKERMKKKREIYESTGKETYWFRGRMVKIMTKNTNVHFGKGLEYDNTIREFRDIVNGLMHRHEGSHERDECGLAVAHGLVTFVVVVVVVVVCGLGSSDRPLPFPAFWI